MRILFILFLFINALIADDIISLKKELFDLNLKKVELISSDSAESNNSDITDLDSLILKENSILLKIQKETISRRFYFQENISGLTINIQNIQKKIELNKKLSNINAISRDNLSLSAYILEKELYFMLDRMSNAVQLKESKDNILSILDESKKVLEKIQLEQNQKYQEQFKITKAHYSSLKSLIDYFETNQKSLIIKKFSHYLTIDYISSEIDSIYFIQSNINPFLNNFTKVSFGKIISSFSIIFFLIVSLYYINKKILRKKIMTRIFSREIFLFTVFGSIHLGLLVFNNIHIYIQNVIYFAYYFVGTVAIIKLIDIMFLKMLISKEDISFRKEIFSIIIKVSKFAIIAIGILIYLSSVGVEIKGIITSLGIASMAFVLASKDSIANFFGSLNILLDNSFSNGDWIEAKDIEGTVVELGMRSTKIRTFSNALVTIPNSVLATAHIINWSKRKIGRKIKLTISIPIDSERHKVRELIYDIQEMLKTHNEISLPGTHKVDNKKNSILIKEDLIGIKESSLVFLEDTKENFFHITVYAFSKAVEWESWLHVKEDVLFRIWALIEKNELNKFSGVQPKNVSIF